MGVPPWQTFPMKVLSREHAERVHAVEGDEDAHAELFALNAGPAAWLGIDAQLYGRFLDRLNFASSTRLRYFQTVQYKDHGRAQEAWQSTDQIWQYLPDIVSPQFKSSRCSG